MNLGNRISYTSNEEKADKDNYIYYGNLKPVVDKIEDKNREWVWGYSLNKPHLTEKDKRIFHSKGGLAIIIYEMIYPNYSVPIGLTLVSLRKRHLKSMIKRFR